VSRNRGRQFKLGNVILSPCIHLRSDTDKNTSWAIRNCGLLLLRSLIDCLFGTSESKFVNEAGWDGRSIKLSYDRYPALPELLIRLLSLNPDIQTAPGSAEIGAVESVFPALDIIRRAGPPENYRNEIFSSISNHLSSKIWHVRDIAARTICTLLLHDGWLPEVIDLLRTESGSGNRLHGILLSVRYLLERRFELSPATASSTSYTIKRTIIHTVVLTIDSWLTSSCKKYA
jgi:hypothetical protein